MVYKLIPGESKASYEVGETFINQNNRFNVAIGTTPQINGEIQVDQTNLQNSQVDTLTIDILTGAATSQILMSDYGFGPIQLAGILGTQDQVKLILNFVARSE